MVWSSAVSTGCADVQGYMTFITLVHEILLANIV